jgi:predicted small lipoprotein YifL
MKRIRLAMAILAVVATAAGCGDKATSPNPPAPPPPPPGSAIVSLATPNSDDGAVVVTLTGPGLSTFATASSGDVFYSRLASAQEARVIVVGDVTAGPLFTFKLAAGSNISAYTATVQQVANRSDALRASTSSYTLTIAAAP